MTPIIITLTFLASINGTEPSKQVIQWDGTLRQCEIQGQIEVARWVGEHPGSVFLGKYKCVAEPIPGGVA